ncbi:hypothetical protein [Anaerotignum sp. MB30-C6]|uniref:hypothetical protein n=1 Tax=Anaerotignum sp. MB30-C6 TaxID=3070814 RepID=UPI0027DAD64C|nr:hypothetical protein [Anaerotignum sp. MB30-C6]WMI81800.1 hypothetical protein RBQ60_03475 [Anaerotignum sp. MB30-C6]WMI81899.1 hypothetical protein RBQ60_03990 [Anaerotignum sp. MB30-C6]
MSQPAQPTMLSCPDLAKRWGRDVKTIRKLIAEKKIKPNKITNMFPLDYIEAIEKADIDLDTVSAFALRAKDRKIEQLEKENAMLKSTLLQVAVTANEVAAQLMKGQAV